MGRKNRKEFLFPRNLNFSKVCSCHECCTKIRALKAFEKELLSKLRLVEGCKIQFIRSEQRCRNLVDNIEFLVNLFDLLHDNLKKVNKDLGLSSPLEECDWVTRSKNVYTSMNTILYGHEKSVNMNMDRTYKREEGEVRKMISFLLRLYQRCRITDKAHELLNEILEIENQHERDRKSAKELDPSFSKVYIEMQIELLKEFPFEEMERETKEIFDKMSPRKENLDLLNVVINGISYTSRQMFQTSNDFWQKCLKINCNVKGHDLSGLEIILDSLTNQMKLCKEMLNKDFVPSIAHIIDLCQKAEAEGFCPQGLCSTRCTYHH